MTEPEKIPEMSPKEGLITTALLLMEIIKEGDEEDICQAASGVSFLGTNMPLILKYWDRAHTAYIELRKKNEE